MIRQTNISIVKRGHSAKLHPLLSTPLLCASSVGEKDSRTGVAELLCVPKDYPQQANPKAVNEK